MIVSVRRFSSSLADDPRRRPLGVVVAPPMPAIAAARPTSGRTLLDARVHLAHAPNSLRRSATLAVEVVDGLCAARAIWARR